MSREEEFCDRAPAGRKDDGFGNADPQRRKPRWSLVPWSAMIDVVRVLEYGAERYGDHNWRRVENGRVRYWDAAMRHLVAWQAGEKNDPDTGASHLAHAAADVLFLIALGESE